MTWDKCSPRDLAFYFMSNQTNFILLENRRIPPVNPLLRTGHFFQSGRKWLCKSRKSTGIRQNPAESGKIRQLHFGEKNKEDGRKGRLPGVSAFFWDMYIYSSSRDRLDQLLPLLPGDVEVLRRPPAGSPAAEVAASRWREALEGISIVLYTYDCNSYSFGLRWPFGY